MKQPSASPTLTPPAWKAAPLAGWICNPALAQVRLAAEGFEPISLEEMEDVALLDRIDVKFVLTHCQLLGALASLEPEYWMLEVNGLRLNHYRSLYFDTPGFELYTAHVNQRPERYKVRCREYVDSRLAFLEVKHHTRKERTLKERLPARQMELCLGPAASAWLRQAAPLDADALRPSLWNTFTRLTLVNKQCCERVTLDLEVAFSAGERALRLDGLAVAEVKMDLDHLRSPFIARMRELRVQRQGFSKYAFGVAALCPGVKTNALKPRMLWVERRLKGLFPDE